jgi:hypothetical protein
MTGPLVHEGKARPDVELQKEARAHVDGAPLLRFLGDVLAALHQGDEPLRTADTFFATFKPRMVLEALQGRPDLRVKLMTVITGGPSTLVRRLSPSDLATQIDLLSIEDLPAGERAFRRDEDRNKSVKDLYIKYLDPMDLAAYLPAAELWSYESQDRWWTREANRGRRALALAELRSLRKHQLLSDSQILDVIGDEALERDLPLPVRTRLRAAARKAAREKRPFTDSDVFACGRTPDGTRDLTDDLAEHLSLATLRKVVSQAVEALGLHDGAGASGAVRAEQPARESADKRLPGIAPAPAAVIPTPQPVIVAAPSEPPPPFADEVAIAFDDLAIPEEVNNAEGTAPH